MVESDRLGVPAALRDEKLMSPVRIESLMPVSSRWDGENGRLIEWKRV